MAIFSNPRGRPVSEGRLVHIGFGDRVHILNPATGRALCSPKLVDLRPAQGEKVTCYRCQHLMQLNRTLRGSDLATGNAETLVAAARTRARA
jgi:hypothetical protein